MSTTRIYHPDVLVCGEVTELGADASNHLIRVLRSKTGSRIILFNGDGFDYHCKTLDSNAKKTLVQVETRTTTNSESNLHITLLQGLSRQHRMEFTIQKSVELGVSRIIPLICTRSNTKLSKEQQMKKLWHWQKVAISACEQSGRSIVPEVTDIVTVDSVTPWLNSKAAKFVLNPETGISLKRLAGQTATEINKIEICIGPEGGLTQDEVVFFNDSHFTNLRFGPRVLRTETAGPAVVSALQVLWGDC